MGAPRTCSWHEGWSAQSHNRDTQVVLETIEAGGTMGKRETPGEGEGFRRTPSMIMASRVVCPVSSGLPPNPTLKSHCADSQTEQPYLTCCMASCPDSHHKSYYPELEYHVYIQIQYTHKRWNKWIGICQSHATRRLKARTLPESKKINAYLPASQQD